MTLAERKIYEFALYKEQAGTNIFGKDEFEDVMGKISTKTFQKAIERLKNISFTIEEDQIINEPVFKDISYTNGNVTFSWSDSMKRYVLNWTVN